MKKMDKDGLLLCSMQAKIFASSLENTESSSEIFIRRFMLSNLVSEFDSTAVLDDSLTTQEVFTRLDEEYGKTSYGSVKYPKEVLYWIGYLYRYMAYTYELSSRSVYKMIKPKELKERYYVYHTFDCAQAIERIFEEKDISFDKEELNRRLLALMRKRKYQREVEIKNTKSKYKLSVIYKGNKIGEIVLSKNNHDVFDLVTTFIDDKYLHNGLRETAIEKTIELAKNNSSIKFFRISELKTNEQNINSIKKLGFEYLDEDDEVAYYIRKTRKK